MYSFIILSQIVFRILTACIYFFVFVIHLVGYTLNALQNIGFKKLDFDLELFSVIYSAHMLSCKMKEFNDESVIKNIFDFYIDILGEKRAKKNCRIIV